MILMLFETKFQDQNCCTFDLEFIFQILDKRLKGILLHHLDFFSSSLLPQVSQSFAFTLFSLSSTCFALTLHVGCLSSFSNSFPTVKLDQMIIPWILNYCSGKIDKLNSPSNFKKIMMQFSNIDIRSLFNFCIWVYKNCIILALGPWLI